ncbi:MAG: hypothetical protein ACEPOV_12535 [Hyphomicrobiales bacterium]
MKAITDFLFRLKTYQLFILFVIAPFINGIIFILERATSQPIIDYPIIPIYHTVNIICNLFIFYYYYSIFQELKTEIPNGIKPKGKSLIFIVIYAFIGCTAAQFLGAFMHERFIDIVSLPQGGTQHQAIVLETLLYIIPLLFFYLTLYASTIYIIYMSSRTLTITELKREVSLVDYISDIVCLLFFPIGIWFVHPRIQKAYINKTEVKLSPNIIHN